MASEERSNGQRQQAPLQNNSNALSPDRTGSRLQTHYHQPHRSVGSTTSAGTGNTATMEQVFFNLHCKIAQGLITRTTPAFRSFLEHAILLLAGA
jgi:hypothetical protein